MLNRIDTEHAIAEELMTLPYVGIERRLMAAICILQQQLLQDGGCEGNEITDEYLLESLVDVLQYSQCVCVVVYLRNEVASTAVLAHST